MADKQSYDLNTDKSVRQLDKLEQRLKRVDSLLQQSQRRGDVLGKMDISPKLALNDKLSDHLTRIENRLLGLHRKIFASTLQINNYATAEIAGVETYLRALTEKKWMIKFEAISWGNLFTGSFSEWLNGQNLMTSIAAELNKPELFQEAGKQAGDQFFQSFLEAIDPDMVADKFNNMELNANVNSSSNSESGSGIGDFFKGVLSDTISGTVSNLLSNWITGNKKDKPSNESSGNNKRNRYRRNRSGGSSSNGRSGNNRRFISSGNIGSSSGNIKRNRSGGNRPKPQQSWFSKTVSSLKENSISAFISNLVSAKKPSASKILEKKPSLLQKSIDSTKQSGGSAIKGGKNPGSSLWGKFKNWGSDLLEGAGSKLSKGAKAVSNFAGNTLKGGRKILGKALGPLSLLMDGAEILGASSGRERAQLIGSSIFSFGGGLIGGAGGTLVAPGVGTVGGSMAGSTAGGYIGEKVGGYLFDLFYGKEEPAAGAVAQGAMASLRTKPNVNPNPSIVPSNRNVLPPVIPTGPLYNPIRVPNIPFGTVPPIPMGTGATPITPTATMQAPPVVQKQILDPSIQVNLPNGAVQLTVNQPELDYEKIASIVGMRISNSVQLAWQNTRLR